MHFRMLTFFLDDRRIESIELIEFNEMYATLCVILKMI